jgi:hypothetical protein
MVNYQAVAALFAGHGRLSGAPDGNVVHAISFSRYTPGCSRENRHAVRLGLRIGQSDVRAVVVGVCARAASEILSLATLALAMINIILNETRLSEITCNRPIQYEKYVRGGADYRDTG